MKKVNIFNEYVMSSTTLITQRIAATLSPKAHLFGFADCQQSVGCFHTQVTCFIDPNPSIKFQGFLERELFDVAVALPTGTGGHGIYRLERDADTIFYSVRTVDTNAHTSHVDGQALACKKGSLDEAVFIGRAVDDLIEDASAPLRHVRESIFHANLVLDYAEFKRKLEDAIRVGPVW